ncbi:hypothetical protein G7085_02510 [Tessaracoccus sp. HDW20]|nr:hypothetical protein [Tessaracoccus coleopterorum]
MRRSRRGTRAPRPEPRPGDTDLTWTRLTRWRALLAAALDQSQQSVTGPSSRPRRTTPRHPARRMAQVQAPGAGQLREGRLRGRQRCRAEHREGRHHSAPHRRGSAVYQVPGQPERTVALRRRPLTDLLTEELRRMDADDIFELAASQIVSDAEGR